MVRPKGCPKRYLYRGQINYLKIAKETDSIQINKLKKITKKAAKIRVKTDQKIARKQDFIDTYGDIEAALKLLDQKARDIIIHLYGLDGSEPMTQDAIGKKLFLSSSLIGRIKHEALDRLEPLKKAPESDEPQT